MSPIFGVYIRKFGSLWVIIFGILLLVQPSASVRAQVTVDAVDDNYQLINNQEYSFPVPGLLVNDTPGTTVVASNPTTTGGAAVTLNSDGSWSVASPGDFVGTVSFTYTIDDGTGMQDTATVNLTYVAPVDAVDDTYTLTNDQNYSFPAPGLLANDTPNATIVASDAATTAGLAVTVNADGSWSIVSDGGFTGSTSFSYTIQDGTGRQDIATVTLTYDAPPPAPVDAVDDYYTVPSNTYSIEYAASAGLLANDTPGVTIVRYDATTTQGTPVQVESDGLWRIADENGFTGGSASFTYTIQDGSGAQDSATVYVTFEGISPPQVGAVDDYYTLENNQSSTNFSSPGLLNNDASGATIIAADTATIQGIAVQVNGDGSWSMGDPKGYLGDDSFTYTIDDGTGTQYSATVYLTFVLPSIHAVDDAYTIPNNQDSHFDAPGLLANDSNTPGTYVSNIVINTAEGGMLIVGGDGGWAILSPNGFVGTISFTYTITDDTRASDTATVTLTYETPHIGCVFQTEIPESECDSLVNLYNSTNGANWTIHTGWNVTNSPCTWYGISCSGEHIWSIQLSANNLSGTIPPLPPFLGDLSLSGNQLTGSIPELPPSLSVLSLSNNQLTGSIPALPATLTTLFLTHNQLSGAIPALPPVMFTLSIANNQLSGTIPDFPASVQSVLIANNQLTGIIPDLPADMLVFFASNNHLTGTIPALPPSLYELSVVNNQLTGTIPALPSILYLLQVSENNLSGEIPASIASTGINTTSRLLLCGGANDLYSNDSAANAFINALRPGWSPANRCLGVASVTPTPTPTSTNTPTETATDISFNTNTPTPTYTSTNTNTPANTSTETPTPTETETDISFETNTPVFTATLTATNTYTPTFTNTPTNTVIFTSTPTYTPTLTPTDTATDTPTNTPSATSTATPTATFTSTATYTATSALTPTDTASPSLTPTLTQTITPSITPTATSSVNLPPIANADTYTMPVAFTKQTIAAPGVLANDTDPEGQPLTIGSQFPFVVSAPIARQAVSVNIDPDGTVHFLPEKAGNYVLTYVISDGVNSRVTGTITIVVTANLPPIANPDSYTILRGGTLTIPASSGVLANDSDPEGQSLRMISTLVDPRALDFRGTFNPDGSFTITSTNNRLGSVPLIYEMTDGVNRVAGRITIMVIANLPPIANPDSYTILRGGTLTIPASSGVLANDSDPEGQPLSMIPTMVDPRALDFRGTFNPDGSFTITSTNNHLGTVPLIYEMTDGVNRAAGRIIITVIANLPPIANPDSYTILRGGTLTIPASSGVLANDTDPEGQRLSMVSTMVDPRALDFRGTFNPDGSFTITSTNNHLGTVPLIYEMTDGVNRAAGRIIITVNANLPPIANDDTYTMLQGGTLTIPASSGVLANDTDPEGQPLRMASTLVDPQGMNFHGTYNPDGSFTITTTSNRLGSVPLIYEMTDGVNRVSGRLTITVLSNTPFANEDAYIMLQGTTLTIPAPGPLANDSDPGGRPLSMTRISANSHGHMIDAHAPDGSFTYHPMANFVGTGTIRYTVSNGVSESQGVIRVTVLSNTPVASDDTYTITQGGTLTIPAPGVLENDTDPQGQPLTVVNAEIDPTHRNFRGSFNPDGSFTITSVGRPGRVMIRYQISNGSNRADATMIVTVVPNR